MGDEPADVLDDVISRLVRALEGLGIHDFALTGGIAVGVWAAPRVTRDIDVCGPLPEKAVEPLMAFYDGVRFGPGDLPDLVRFRLGDWDVYLFVSKGAYDQLCLERAVETQLGATRVRVVTAEDLLIHKTIKLRTDRKRVLQDLADMRALLEAQSQTIDWIYIRRWLPADEADFLASIATLDDEAILRRLSGK
jgi:hypothetical protein